MKRIIYPLLLVYCFAFTIVGCSEKQIAEIKEDLATQIMTSGTWIIADFEEGPDNITATFTGYECQFYKNGTCEAIKGAEKVAGTWSASTANQTINGQFPATATPVNKINGTWKVVKSSITTGEFTQTKNGMDYKMKLVKK